MAKYILLTKLNSDAIQKAENFQEVTQFLKDKIQTEVPEVTWLSHYLILGPYDYLDIFEAPDNEAAAKVAVIVRAFGHGTTEIWPAVKAETFRQVRLAWSKAS